MLTPHEYQRQGIDAAIADNVLIADEPGLGKTLQAIEAVKSMRWSTPGLYCRPVLVIAPKKTLQQWAEAIIEQEAGTEEDIHILGPAGAGMPDKLGIDAWVLCHYEAVALKINLFYKKNWSVIICDEAHRIKNRVAKRTIAIKQLSCIKRIALTGTPMEKSPADLWSIINWLYPDKFRSYWSWYSRFVDVRKNYLGYEEIVGGKNQEQMAAVLEGHVLRRTKQEVAPQLPPLISTEIPIELNSDQKHLYNQFATAKDIELTVKDMQGKEVDNVLIKNVLAKIVRLQQITADPYILDYRVSSAKMDWLADYLDDNPTEPIVIFTRFRMLAFKIASLYKADIIVGNHGGTSAAFLQGRNRLIVGTIAAMGEGLNLQRADTAIFMDQEWSTVLMRQAIDRIHRINITSPKQAIFLKGVGTVDSLVLKALKHKWTEQDIVYHYLRGDM